MSISLIDFLLEFATLGHENNADVPNIIHPYLPQEDLESIGITIRLMQSMTPM